MKNDLISRKDVITALIDADWIKTTAQQAVIAEVLNKIPSVKPKKGKWIFVTEKLPEEDGYYIVTIKIPFYENGAYGYITGAAYYISCVMKWFDANGEVIAWMPLPEPYTEVEDEISD